MIFTKMHGLGNDYVYVDCTEKMIESPEKTAVFVSDRHRGVGSDGLILIGPSSRADFEMMMYNADGSRGEMCGNGIRCVGKYVYDYGLTDKTEIAVETLAGIRNLSLRVEGGVAREVRVDMGVPILSPGRIPVDIPGFCGDMVKDHSLEVQGKPYKITAVSMGNPHAVIFTGGIDAMDLEEIGPGFENHRFFPNRVNTEFVEILDETHLRMRVWERGSGETMACGTGACAVAVAGVLNGYSHREVTVHLRGGDLDIEWNEKNGHVYMTGTAEKVFDGTLVIPEESLK